MSEPTFRRDPIALLTLALALCACVSKPLSEPACEAGSECDDRSESGGTGGRTGGTGGASGTATGGASGTATGGSSPGGQCGGIAVLDQSCSPSPNADACTQCVLEECCESVAAITNGGPATDLADCWYDCETQECYDECYAAFPDGIEGFDGFEACTTVNCSPLDACDVSLCGKCTAMRCTCEYAACITDLECNFIRQCVGGCDADTACAQACFDEHPQGADQAELYMTCLAQNCIDDC